MVQGKHKDYTDGVTDIMGKVHPNRKFRVGQWVVTKSGIKAKVLGSALYVTGYEYRIKDPNRPKAMYRHESELKLFKEKK
jgi:hypothetical protein